MSCFQLPCYPTRDLSSQVAAGLGLNRSDENLQIKKKKNRFCRHSRASPKQATQHPGSGGALACCEVENSEYLRKSRAQIEGDVARHGTYRLVANDNYIRENHGAKLRKAIHRRCR